MINKMMLPKAYAEVLEILKFVPKDDYDKVPNYIIENMQQEKDLSYEYKLTFIEGFENQKLLKETEAILAVFYRDYWASDEQKKKLQEIEVIERKIAEEEKVKKYESKDYMQKIISDNSEDVIQTLLVKSEKRGFFSVLIKKVRNFFGTL